MAVGPNNDPIPYQGWTKQVFRGLVGTVLDVTKAGAGGNPIALGLVIIENTSAAVAYIQIFDALASSVTLATTHPDLEIPVAANTGFTSFVFPTAGGTFPNGVCLASTTTSEGNTGSTASKIRVTVFYR